MPLGTGDFMAAYRDYGCTHIEWINATSLNVVFADPHSVKRPAALLLVAAFCSLVSLVTADL